MMVWSINILVLAVGFFIVGMYNPQFILFWMEKPARFPIILLVIVLFMVSSVMFGEANKDKQKELAKQTKQIDKTVDNTVPVIPVAPVPVNPVK